MIIWITSSPQELWSVKAPAGAEPPRPRTAALRPAAVAFPSWSNTCRTPVATVPPTARMLRTLAAAPMCPRPSSSSPAGLPTQPAPMRRKKRSQSTWASPQARAGRRSSYTLSRSPLWRRCISRCQTLRNLTVSFFHTRWASFFFFFFLNLRSTLERKWYPITFVGSIIWIALYSYLMIWWATVAGNVMNIPPPVRAIASRSSDDDCTATVCLIHSDSSTTGHGLHTSGWGHVGARLDHQRAGGQARQGGHGRFLVGWIQHLWCHRRVSYCQQTSAVHTVLHDSEYVCVPCSLPVPWLLYAITHSGAAVSVSSVGLGCSVSLLFLMLLAVFLCILIFKWKMTKGMGFLMLVFYFVFVVISIGFSYDLYKCPIWAVRLESVED